MNWLIKLGVKKMLDKLDGKKTHIVMIALVLTGILDAVDKYCGGSLQICQNVNIPSWIYPIYGVLGSWARSVAKAK